MYVIAFVYLSIKFTTDMLRGVSNVSNILIFVDSMKALDTIESILQVIAMVYIWVKIANQLREKHWAEF